MAYATFSTSHWMIAVDAPSDRAALELDVTMPAEWKAAGTFGFVAGSFTEATEMSGSLPLTYLGSGFSADELRTIFRETPRMAAFFEERAGVPFPGRHLGAFFDEWVGPR